MAGFLDKPLLLVDVDGVISLWGFASDRRPGGTFVSVDGIPHFLSEEAGRHLLDLAGAFDLVWCTGWEEKANEYLPHALGIPGPLPFLRFDDHEVAAGETTPGHWKLSAIDAYAGDRPLAWVDDAFNDACHDWAAARGVPTLLVTTEPVSGLTREHTERLMEWAGELRRAASKRGSPLARGR